MDEGDCRAQCIWCSSNQHGVSDSKWLSWTTFRVQSTSAVWLKVTTHPITHASESWRWWRSLNAFSLASDDFCCVMKLITVLLRSGSAMHAGSCLRSISIVTNGRCVPSIKLHYWMGVGFWVAPHGFLALLGTPSWKLMSTNKNSFCKAPCLQDLVWFHFIEESLVFECWTWNHVIHWKAKGFWESTQWVCNVLGPRRVVRLGLAEWNQEVEICCFLAWVKLDDQFSAFFFWVAKPNKRVQWFKISPNSSKKNGSRQDSRNGSSSHRRWFEAVWKRSIGFSPGPVHWRDPWLNIRFHQNWLNEKLGNIILFAESYL